MTLSDSNIVGPPLTGLVLVVLMCHSADSVSADADAAVDHKQMENWWTDLEKPEPDASHALLHLADKPKETVHFLKDRLRPLRISGMKLEDLLAQLTSDRNDVWESAFEELEYLDPRLAIDLEPLMDKVKDAPARQRLVELMSGRPAGYLKGKDITLRPVGGGYNFIAPGSWWAEHRISRLNIGHSNPKKKWTRAVRAIVLLEHIGTPDAIAILKDMASGHPDAQPTKVAKESLARFNAKVAK